MLGRAAVHCRGLFSCFIWKKCHQSPTEISLKKFSEKLDKAWGECYTMYGNCKTAVFWRQRRQKEGEERK